MIKKIMLTISLFLLLMITTGCQWAAKNVGGDYTINLEEGQKLINVTWKDSELWYLTRPMNENDVAETYLFEEDSTYGVLEGTVTIIETKK